MGALGTSLIALMPVNLPGVIWIPLSLLGGIMKKPLAGTMLLFLCFPVKMFIWIFIAAAVGSKLITLKPEQEPSANYSKQ